MRHAAYALVLAAFVAASASAAVPRGSGPTGMWDRDDGLGGVRISQCGDALCGHIVWLKERGGPGHIGQRVLYDMRQSAENTWSGSAQNPEDGQTYAGTMVLSGSRLLTRGCALGGLVCKTVGLSRAR